MIQLKILYGATTLNLQSGYTVLDGFYPAAPDAETATDRFDVLIIDSSTANLDAKLAAIRAAIGYARQNKDELSPAYLVYAPDASAPLYRTRILDAKILLESGFDRRRRRNRALVGLAVEHDPFWEANTESELPLTSAHGSGSTGVLVYNQWSTSYKNYVEIAAADAGGDLPAPLRLSMSSFTGTLYVGSNWRSDPANLAPILEGEAADELTDVSDATCSGGYYGRFEADLVHFPHEMHCTWEIPSADLDRFAGRYFKLLARWQTATPNANFTWQLQVSYITARPVGAPKTYTPIWTGPEFELDASTTFTDLGVVQLPPWLLGLTALDTLALQIIAKFTEDEPPGFPCLDYLYLLPLDAYRYFTSLAWAARLVDDGVLNLVYTESASATTRKGAVTAYGAPIMLQPGVVQRIYFLEPDSAITATLFIRAYYRQRRSVP